MVWNKVSLDLFFSASTGWSMITQEKQRHHTTFHCPSSVTEADRQNDQLRVPMVIHGRTRTWTQDLLYYSVPGFLSPRVVCSQRGDGLCFTPSTQDMACLADSEPSAESPSATASPTTAQTPSHCLPTTDHSSRRSRHSRQSCKAPSQANIYEGVHCTGFLGVHTLN